MSIFKNFTTDKELEVNGVEVDYGDFSLFLARAGGANQMFEKRMATLCAPYRRQIETGTMPTEKQKQIMRQAYSETVVKGWDARCEAEAGKFSAKACEELFEKLPDLFDLVMKDASGIAMFRKDVLEAGAKN